MKLSVEGIASFSGRRPWWTLLGWVLVLVVAGALSSTLLESALDGEQGPTQELEFKRAENLVNYRFGPLDGNDQQGASEGPETSSELILIVAEDPQCRLHAGASGALQSCLARRRTWT